ncbi:MAG TPA: Gfo/Idh/MocA family oxidoreductase [Polyangiaceae bacterium]|nr:Gfo/Idh/MocA family oxidoreductase [Polyangiaceae bacterium]
MSKKDKVRYAVVGLGWFAQEAILPAFARAKNAELVALVSGDDAKLAELAPRYGARLTVKYDGYDDLMASKEIDAVYIALPNTMHRDYTVRAARAGVHVLCEKPLAMNEAECREMIAACRQGGVKLMVAYRLHFEKANLAAIEAVKSGEIGEPRLLSTVFAMQVEAGNSRLKADLGAGPLYDIGVYCINAARYLFRDEPREVVAFSGRERDDERFDEVDEQLGAVLRFADDRLATFAISFGAHEYNRLDLVGTTGHLALDPAYSHSTALKLEVDSEDKTHGHKFAHRDQVAPEIIYFSDCIRENREPEPSGEEGLADVRIIGALQESAATGRSVALEPLKRDRRPEPSQEKQVAPPRKPKLVRAEPPH